MVAAFPPIPPDTERGAIVLPDEPMSTPVFASDVSIMFPEPLGVRVRLLLLPVVEIVLSSINILFVPKSMEPMLSIS